MITKKKDNPAALALMSVVLVVALFFAGRTLFGSQSAAGDRTTVVSAGAAADTALAGRGVSLPTSDRDPFSSPRLHAARETTDVPGTVAPAGPQPEDAGLPAGRITPGKPRLAPIPPHIEAHVQPGGTRSPIGVAGYVRPGGTGVVPANLGPSAEEAALSHSLRVTAIVMGERPYAVVETGGGGPRTLHIWEVYRSLTKVVITVVAIRPGEIVLKGRTGLWTVPLATTESEAAPAYGDR